MKKSLILKSLGAGLAVYAAAGFLGVPYVLKNILPDTISEATNGGRFSVGSAAFNPFTFHLKVNDMAFKTPSDADLFAMRHLALNIDPFAYLWKGEWLIKNILLVEPHIAVNRDENGAFNFAFLSEQQSEEDAAQEPSKPLKLLIKRFTLKEGRIDYRDTAEGKAYELGVGPIGFSLDTIDLRDLSSAEGQMRLYATINGSGFVDVRGKIEGLSPLKIGGNVAFESGKLYTLWSYFKEKFPIEVADGKAAFAFDYRFDSSDVNATELSNLTFDMQRVRIVPKGEGRNIFTLGSLTLREGNVFPMRKMFSAESVGVSGISVNAARAADGTIDWLRYLEEIQEAFPEDENETKEPWQYRVGNVSAEGVGAQWSDHAPATPYRVNLANLRLHTGMVESDPKAPLSLSMATDAIRMVRLGDEAQVAAIGAVGVDGVVLNREGRFAEVSNVSVHSPEIALKRLSDGSLDVAKYGYAAPKKGEAEETQAWGYRIGEIGVKEGKATFRDEVPRRNVSLSLDQLNAALKGFESDPGVKNAFSFEGRLNGKSTLKAQGEIVRSSMRSRGTFDVAHIDPALADPYIEPATYASLRRGDLSVAGEYAYALDKASVRGKLSLHDWVMNDSRDDSVLLGWRSIGVTPFAYAYPDNRLKINQLSIDGLYTNALIDEQKVLNYTTLAKKTPGKPTAAKKGSENPFGLDVVKLLVRNSSMTFSDLSLPLPFKTYIHDLEGSVMGISTTKDVTTFVKLRGAVDQYGLARIDGSLNTAAPKNFTDLKVVFENLELAQYTPYSLQFLGYYIEGGKLFLNLGYKIDQGALKGDNQVIIRQIELGKEKEGGSPWPMRLVVALLEDSDGVIDVALPVQGDVNNPEFKYGKVVWQVITNLFTKAVTAPFRLLGSLLGIEDNSLESIDFDGGSAVLLPPQIEKLDQIVTLLHKRPKLSLEVYGGWDETEDAYALRGGKLVAQARKLDKKLEADVPEAIPLDLLEDMAEDVFKSKELRALRNELEEKYPEEAAYARHYSAELTERLIPLQPLTPEELQALAARRSEAIRAHLIQSPDLEKRVIVKESEKGKAKDSKEVPVRLNVIVP
ncbi:MAG: DUF748 domain-containing protein [Campylobacterales bacterium]|nr:DUF748 domain-containing protein [Campylobacterales bacterium]